MTKTQLAAKVRVRRAALSYVGDIFAGYDYYLYLGTAQVAGPFDTVAEATEAKAGLIEYLLSHLSVRELAPVND